MGKEKEHGMDELTNLEMIVENFLESYRKQGRVGEEVLCIHLLDCIKRSKENAKEKNKTLQQDE